MALHSINGLAETFRGIHEDFHLSCLFGSHQIMKLDNDRETKKDLTEFQLMKQILSKKHFIGLFQMNSKTMSVTIAQKSHMANRCWICGSKNSGKDNTHLRLQRWFCSTALINTSTLCHSKTMASIHEHGFPKIVVHPIFEHFLLCASIIFEF